MARLGKTTTVLGGICLLTLAGAISTSMVKAAVSTAVAPPTQSTPQTLLNDSDAEPKDRPSTDSTGGTTPMPAGLGVAPESGVPSTATTQTTGATTPTAAVTATATASSSQQLDVSHVHFYADTDHPKNGTYTIGQQANICSTITGMIGNDTIHLIIKDADGNQVSDQYMNVVPHNAYWHGCTPVPSTKMGFYRVGIHTMRTNITLASLRSRPGGFLTYVVLPDPKLRPLYPSTQTFFGMQMPANIVYLAPNLGVRWVLATWSYGWRDGEHQYPNQFTVNRANNPNFPGTADKTTLLGAPYQMYETPTLYMYPIADAAANDWQTTPPPIIVSTANFLTAALTEGSPAGVTWWANFVNEVTKGFVDFHPDSVYDRRLYQMTWEPRDHGTNAYNEVVRIYQIAYPLIHAIDPKAIVAGPGVSAINDDQRMYELSLFIRANLAKYMDAFSIHTYTVWPSETAQGHSASDPNPSTPPGPYYTLADSIHRAKALIEGSIGHDLPMYSTEFGGNTKCPDPSLLPCVSMELPQAQGLIRENLILMGEGFKMAISFYGSDYVTQFEQGYYGLFYNLDPDHDWYHPYTVGPKPSAAAYAAMTYLLEGHYGVKPVTGLSGSTIRGYSYAPYSSVANGQTVIALWDFYGPRNNVAINVGVPSVTVYDWMGNGQTMQTKSGLLTVNLSKDPIYIAGVSPAMWGAGSPGAIPVTEPAPPSSAPSPPLSVPAPPSTVIATP